MTTKARPLLSEEEFQKLVAERDPDSLIEVLSRYVKERPGRRRVHATAADRQKAFRAKKSARVEQLEEQVRQLEERLNKR
jgi:uncharacterized protein YceH (UPF0502 family)